MPYTFALALDAASLLIVFPPPQPTSRMTLCEFIEMWFNPQSVRLEWLAFMRRRMNRPIQPLGCLHWLSDPPPIFTANFIGRNLSARAIVVAHCSSTAGILPEATTS